MKTIFIFIISIFLGGCASITTGANQSVSVNTDPDSGAKCELSNDKGVWYVSSTPAFVTVNRSYSKLNVTCKKELKNGFSSVDSHTKGMAWGNIIAGGIIGGAVDVGTGAAYDYPSPIRVPLK